MAERLSAAGTREEGRGKAPKGKVSSCAFFLEPSRNAFPQIGSWLQAAAGLERRTAAHAAANVERHTGMRTAPFYIPEEPPKKRKTNQLCGWDEWGNSDI